MILTKVEHADYQGKEYRKITLSDGKTYNVKSGQNGILQAKWGLLESGIGKEITLTMGDYQGKPFVADFVIGEKPTIAPEASTMPEKPHQEEKVYKADPAKIESFETQKAIDFVTASVAAGVMTKDDPLYKGAYLWAKARLPAANAILSTLKQEDLDKIFRTEEPTREPYFASGADLFKWANKKGMSLKRFNELVQCSNPNDIKDASVAYKMITNNGEVIK